MAKALTSHMIDCSQILGLHVFRVGGNVGERM